MAKKGIANIASATVFGMVYCAVPAIGSFLSGMVAGAEPGEAGWKPLALMVIPIFCCLFGGVLASGFTAALLVGEAE
jgi:hypothetical protein